MKKIILLLFVTVIVFSLCACGASLNAAQKKCCDEADKVLESISKKLDMSFERKIEETKGKKLYVATFDFDGELTDSNATTFQQYFMPVAEKILGEENIYIVLYLRESGEEKYRLVDSKLSPDVLD